VDVRHALHVRASNYVPAWKWGCLAGSAVNFEDGNIQVHQVLAVKPDGGASGMPLRPDF